MSFEEIMAVMLQTVPDTIDKREGSLIYVTLAPVAAMVAEMYFYGENIRNATIPDTSACGGDDLTRKCAEHGVNRRLASPAVRLGLFTDFNDQPTEVEIGARFAAENISYVVTERITAGQYRLKCELPGIIGNLYFGAVLPLDSSHFLGTAVLGEVITAGDEEEDDETLRERFYIEVNAEPYGGNVVQYEQWLSGIDGVGNRKVFPTPNNEGGRVHCVVTDPQNKPCSNLFLEELKELMDPYPDGTGRGIVPIGHKVTVSTAAETLIDISATILLKTNFTIPNVQPDIEQAITSYFSGLSFYEDTIRISYLKSAILNVEGVLDVFSVLLNDEDTNINLPKNYDDYQIPVMGSLDLTEETS